MSALLLLALGLLAPPGGALQPARVPLVPGQPFLVLWGIPDSLCEGRPDPSAFGMLSNGSAGQFVVFYRDGLGLYPYYDPQNQPVAGGLPQHTSLDMHLLKMDADVTSALPWPDYRGLAAIHWEDWAPLWGRNRGKKEIYREQSRSLLRQFFPDWAPAELDKWAQVDFEAAAQALLLETLQEGRRLRPRALWGFSPYPACPGQHPANATGRCPAADMAQNDEAQWLWKRSSALYPSLQLDKPRGGSAGARRHSSGQLREALRVAAQAGAAHDLPVFPLVRSVYAETASFLSEADLVHTIGESAALGAAGAVVWEKFFSTKTQRGCWELADYVRGVLGPYVVNVTTAARLCGEGLCQGRGRCVRRDPEEPTYLHLPADSFQLAPGADGTADAVRPRGQLLPGHLEAWRLGFQCQWYEPPEGKAEDQEPTSAGGTRTAGETAVPAETPALSRGAPCLRGSFSSLLLATLVVARACRSR
ncbi:hyaluronidase-2 [Lepisosteus oculatus]|uniref:hyaluronidase-2 n=1 Tax=Lepisosteus oculatus TaxID=7918 RepID=UPI003720A1E9